MQAALTLLPEPYYSKVCYLWDLLDHRFGLHYVNVTPFGVPVEPEVKMMVRTSSVPTCCNPRPVTTRHGPTGCWLSVR